MFNIYYMTIKGTNSIDIDLIYPGYTVILNVVNQDMVRSLLKTADKLGCKLILLKYGHFYFREYISTQRNNTISDILTES